MQRLSVLCAGLVLATFVAAAETWSGTVVDTMCKGKDVANHTRECALGCAKGGFGLVTSDGKFLKFDESGNARTLAALKASKKEKDLQATVTGALDDDSVIKVQTIELK